jgi:hypothetical protein
MSQNYIGLIPILINEIKALKSNFVTLENKNIELENEIKNINQITRNIL